MGCIADRPGLDVQDFGMGESRRARRMPALVAMCVISVSVGFAPNAVAAGAAGKPLGDYENPTAGDTPIVPVGAGSTGDTQDKPLTVDRAPNGLPYVAGELIVTYESGTADASQRAIADEFGAETKESLSRIDVRFLKFPEIKAEESQPVRERLLQRRKAQLEREPGVVAADYAQIDAPAGIPNDPLFSYQWGLNRINAPAAWDVTQGANTIMAILDSGMDYANPDIGGVVGEYDFFSNDTNASDTTSGHGTHVAGIAGAITNNGAGVAGTSPDGLFLNLRVCSTTGCPLTARVDAIYAAANYGVDAINMSIGATSCVSNYAASEEVAVDYALSKGVVVVASAGNNACSTPSYPGAYQNAIGVSGTDVNNGDSDFSNFGSWVDVSAPGGEGGNTCTAVNTEDILSTYLVSAGTYCFQPGTSMAAPFVTGVASLLAGQGLSANEIRSRIESTVTDLGSPGFDVLFGHGLVNAAAAVAPPGAAPGPVPGPPVSSSDPCAAAHELLAKAKKQMKRARAKYRKADTEKEKEKAEVKIAKARKAIKRAKEAIEAAC
jgi:thermitase